LNRLNRNLPPALASSYKGNLIVESVKDNWIALKSKPGAELSMKHLSSFRRQAWPQALSGHAVCPVRPT
jgi:hypothetical protein